MGCNPCNTSRFHDVFKTQEEDCFQNMHTMKDGKRRADIREGMKVSIVLKQNQRSGNLTDGIVKDILTKSAKHPHGIKVRLENGLVGRVKRIHEET